MNVAQGLKEFSLYTEEINVENDGHTDFLVYSD